MLEENFFAQFAVPGVHIAIDDIVKAVGVLAAIGKCLAQVMNHIFGFCMLGGIEIVALLHIGERPVLSEGMQITRGVDQNKGGGLPSVQTRCQDLCYSSTEAVSHEDDVGEVEALEEK